MRFFQSALAGLAWILCQLAALCGVLLTIFVVLATVMRYFLGAPYSFTEEFVGLLSFAMAFLALPLCLVENSHIRVQLVTDQLGPVGRKVADAVALLVFLVFALVFGRDSIEFAWFSYTVNAKSEIANLKLFPWMAIIPAIIAVMLLIIIGQALALFRSHPRN